MKSNSDSSGQLQNDDVTIAELKQFVRIYELVKDGFSISEAGREMPLRRPTNLLGKIENWLLPPGSGRQLIDRGKGKDGTVNSSGQQVYDLLHTFLEKKQELLASRLFTGELLSIGATESALNFTLPMILQRTGFLKNVDALGLSITAGNMSAIIREIHRGRITFGFGRRIKSDGIDRHRLLTVARALIFPKNHQFAKLPKDVSGAKRALQDLRYETVIMRPDELTPNFKKEEKVPPPDIKLGKRILLPSVTLVYRWCASELGVGIGYASDWTPTGAEGLLDSLSLEGVLDFPNAELWMYTSSTRRFSEAAIRFRQLILDTYPASVRESTPEGLP